jgi:hypothetical protein
MTNTNKSKAATKTEITGRDAKSCTGKLNNGKRAKFEVGQKVGLRVHMDCDDGGTLTGYRTAVIERIAVGTEHGMHGTTALVALTVEINSYNETTRKVLIAARHLEPVS